MNEPRSPWKDGSRQITDEEARIRNLLSTAGPRPELPEEDLLTLKEALREDWRRVTHGGHEQRRRHGLQLPLALAASVVVAVLVAWWWTAVRTPIAPDAIATVEVLQGGIHLRAASGGERTRSVELREGVLLPAGSVIETPGADEGPTSRLALRLSGGQSVRLDLGTEVRLVSASRLELERGGLYFDSGVRSSAGDAVEVFTPFGTVRDVGTQYEVRLGNGVAAVKVRVREGAVAFESEGHSYTASGGEELSLRPDGSVERSTVSRYGSQWDWVLAAAPTIDIEGLTLQSFLDWVSRETGWRIQFVDDELERSVRSVLLHGSIEGLTPDQSLGAVLPGSGLAYRLEEGMLIIIRPKDGTARHRELKTPD